jgi:hypothetical protein
MRDTVLTLNNFRYLKVATALAVVSIGLYIFHDPLGAPNGGTWVGFTLGTVGALLIVWLAWFGVRKRRYGLGSWTLQEWLSAHVYLGISLIIIATLHAGFQVGWNVHTLTFFLMLVVILSGIYGIYLYISMPEMMSRNRSGQTLNELLSSISALDEQCRPFAVQLGDEINGLVREAGENTQVGGGVWRQLSGADPNCPTARALVNVTELVKVTSGQDAMNGRQLVLLLARKNELLLNARKDVRFRAWLNIWLLFHVPVSVALLVALIVHIVSVFFYR